MAVGKRMGNFDRNNFGCQLPWHQEWAVGISAQGSASIRHILSTAWVDNTVGKATGAQLRGGDGRVSSATRTTKSFPPPPPPGNLRSQRAPLGSHCPSAAPRQALPQENLCENHKKLLSGADAAAACVLRDGGGGGGCEESHSFPSRGAAPPEAASGVSPGWWFSRGNPYGSSPRVCCQWQQQEEV